MKYNSKSQKDPNVKKTHEIFIFNQNNRDQTSQSSQISQTLGQSRKNNSCSCRN